MIRLKAYSVVLIPPHWQWKISWPPPLSPSIAATTKSQCYYMQASDIYINSYVSYEPWTTTSHIWSSDMDWKLSVKGYSSHPNHSHCRSRPPHCRILPHILHPPIPRHLHLWHFTIRLCSQTLWSFERWKNLRQKLPQQRADLPLQKLTSREVAGEVFDALKLTIAWSIATFNAELTGKLVRRFHRYCAVTARKRRF